MLFKILFDGQTFLGPQGMIAHGIQCVSEWVGGLWVLIVLTGFSVQRERWLTESSQRTRGSDLMEFHLRVKYTWSSLRNTWFPH